jgi:hypothetical protein
MRDTTARQNDIMLMLIGVQLSIVGLAIDDLFLLVPVGALFTLAVYTNELRRRR